MKTRRAFWALVCASVALGTGTFVGPASAAAAPANDLIGGAVSVALPYTQTLDVTGATTDADDAQVNSSCGAPVTNNSVWYTFTAGPSDSVLVVDTTGSDFSSGVIIATGTPGSLVTQACSPISSGVKTTSGTTYYILAFDDTDSGGTLQISIHGPGPVPKNDKIAGATAVGALPYSDTLDTTGATTGAADNQVNASCGAPLTDNSVWYKFTAGPGDTNIFVDAFNSNYNVGIIVATGTPGSLTTVACGPFSVVTPTTPGTTYYVLAFDYVGTGGGTLRLDIGDAPTMNVNVFRDTRVDTAGVVHVKGTYTCTDLGFVDISGTLVEVVGRSVALGYFDKPIKSLNCNGNRQFFQVPVYATQGLFAPGKAALFTSSFGCGDVVCVQVDKSQVLVLRHGTLGPSASASSVQSSSTQASLRPARTSRARYGAA
ncbi:MAG: hypothetical protein QOH10_1171, partial [Actinomycetota bacterium]|nr:hypothetical protein [Actinomycetota bacterium]